jgi:NAD-dependent SIR2 family protein deacetylase
MKSAIFLGAGASSAEGAPTQSNLFRDYFELIRTRNRNVVYEMESELRTFFSLMFDIDVDYQNLISIQFPTFEEALGILDLADMRNESFKNYSNINIASNSGRLKRLRIYLILLMAEILHEKLETSRGFHLKLVNNLKSLDKLDKTIFLTTNYDILIDNALLSLYPDILLDYGIYFINFNLSGDWERPDENSVKLFKLHGSLNWLYCPTCNNIKLTPREKGIIKLIREPAEALCKNCETIYSPVIVPPSFFKDFTNVFLSSVWNKAENFLHEVEQIIFCGYSFPSADIHIKYLLKRIQKNRSSGIIFTVINNHPGKSKAEADEEKTRYIRFLGPTVNYTEFSFEEFVNNPSILM